MSSLAWNIKRKMEWMGRNLRKIDDAAELKNWASALRELNSVLKELDIKDYKDNWRPWSQRNKQGMKGGRTDQVESNESYLLRRKRVTVPQVELEESSGPDLMNNGERKGTTDQLASTEPYLLSRMRVTVPQVGLEESSGSDLMNNVDRKWSRPPRVQVEGDDVDLLDPKAAVMKMLKEAKEQQEKTQPQREMSSVEMIKNSEMETEVAGKASSEEHTENIEMWRDCMVEHLRTENKPVQWWGSSKSVIFCTLCSECASPTVRIAAMEEWRKKKKTNNEKVGDFLYKELMIYYDKVE